MSSSSVLVCVYTPFDCVKEAIHQAFCPYTSVISFSNKETCSEFLLQHSPALVLLECHEDRLSWLPDLEQWICLNHLKHTQWVGFGNIVAEQGWIKQPNMCYWRFPIHLHKLVEHSLGLLLREAAMATLPLNQHYTLAPSLRSLMYILPEASPEIILLTEKEVKLLEFLKERTALGASKKEILHEVWGYVSEAETHTLETHVYRLRQKLGDRKLLLLTEEGRYRLAISSE